MGVLRKVVQKFAARHEIRHEISRVIGRKGVKQTNERRMSWERFTKPNFARRVFHLDLIVPGLPESLDRDELSCFARTCEFDGTGDSMAEYAVSKVFFFDACRQGQSFRERGAIGFDDLAYRIATFCLPF